MTKLVLALMALDLAIGSQIPPQPASTTAEPRPLRCGIRGGVR